MKAKQRIIRHKKQSSLKWYIIGAVIAAFALALGNEVAKKGVNKVDAYLSRRRR
jgi:hypothetical protein